MASKFNKFINKSIRSITLFFRSYIFTTPKFKLGINHAHIDYLSSRHIKDLDLFAIYRGSSIKNWADNVWPIQFEVTDGRLAVDYYWAESMSKDIKDAIFCLVEDLIKGNYVSSSFKISLGVSYNLNGIGQRSLYIFDIADSGDNKISIIEFFNKLESDKDSFSILANFKDTVKFQIPVFLARKEITRYLSHSIPYFKEDSIKYGYANVAVVGYKFKSTPFSRVPDSIESMVFYSGRHPDTNRGFVLNYSSGT